MLMVAHKTNSAIMVAMNKTFWAIIAIIVIIFGGIIVADKNKDNSTGSGGAKPTNHVMGEGKSGVRLVEYGDFECSFCGQYYPLVEQVKEKYKEKIVFQFRHLPLVTAHRNALAAARAAEAAHKQGKFWEMYSLLFQNQATWSKSDDATNSFEQYATQLGLDVTKFKADAASTEVNAIVNADINEFKKTKERMGTPTFFLDGKVIKPKSVDEFSKFIDEAIKNKQKQ